jgi:hypothetical protein
LLGAGLLAGRSVRPAPRVARRSWFQKILTGARLASTIWFAVRAVGQKK